MYLCGKFLAYETYKPLKEAEAEVLDIIIHIMIEVDILLLDMMKKKIWLILSGFLLKLMAKNFMNFVNVLKCIHCLNNSKRNN